MTDNKKLGIRLRHLEQHEPDRKRDLSPNTANRKKIFEKLPYQRVGERQNLEEKLKSPKVSEPTVDNLQVQKLIENLKRKSMEVELRDNMIKSLNKQIDELKRDLKAKEREIMRLSSEIERLERNSRIIKNVEKQPHVFQSFRDPVPMGAFAREDRIQDYDKYGKEGSHPKVTNFLTEEVTVMNLTSKGPINERITNQQPEILSPFMALTNNKSTHTSQNSSHEPIHRDTSHTFHGSSNKYNTANVVGNNSAKSALVNPFQKHGQSPFQGMNNTTSSAFNKKPNQFDQKRMSNNVSTDKFNIFNQQSGRSQLKSQNKLTIEDSRQFKFQEFEQSDFRQF